MTSLGGTFSVDGGTHWVTPRGFLGGWTENTPLNCGNIYQAYTDDTTDGLVWSNLLTEPACPIAQ
jgi:hypothetical protein